MPNASVTAAAPRRMREATYTSTPTRRGDDPLSGVLSPEQFLQRILVFATPRLVLGASFVPIPEEVVLLGTSRAHRGGCFQWGEVDAVLARVGRVLSSFSVRSLRAVLHHGCLRRGGLSHRHRRGVACEVHGLRWPGTGPLLEALGVVL